MDKVFRDQVERNLFTYKDNILVKSDIEQPSLGSKRNHAKSRKIHDQVQPNQI